MLITALASWAIAGLATTTDPALATAQMNNGTMLTGLGVALYTSPLKWVVMLAPLGMIFGFGAVMQRASASGAQLFFYLFATLIGVSLSSILCLAQLYLYFLHNLLNRTDIFGNGNRLCRSQPLRVYYEKKYLGLGIFSGYGCHRPSGRNGHQLVLTIPSDDVRDFDAGCVDFCRSDRL